MLTYNKITAISLAVLFFISVLNLVNSNILSTKGILVSAKEKEILQIEKENQALKTKIQELSRLSDLESYSNQMGYISGGKVVYMQSGSGFALK